MRGPCPVRDGEPRGCCAHGGSAGRSPHKSDSAVGWLSLSELLATSELRLFLHIFRLIAQAYE